MLWLFMELFCREIIILFVHYISHFQGSQIKNDLVVEMRRDDTRDAERYSRNRQINLIREI